MTDTLVAVVEAWLHTDIGLKGTVIRERLVAEHGFTGNYQRVKMFLAEARPRIADKLGDADENPLVGLGPAGRQPASVARPRWTRRVLQFRA